MVRGISQQYLKYQAIKIKGATVKESKQRIKMKKYILLIIATTFLTACGSLDKTTITEYDAEGNVIKITETSRDVSDFSAFIVSGDGNATTLSADVSKFNIGYSNWGISWFSVSGVRVKAPVKQEGSNSAEALEQTAEIIGATKTKIQTSEMGVNIGTAKKMESNIDPYETDEPARKFEYELE